MTNQSHEGTANPLQREIERITRKAHYLQSKIAHCTPLGYIRGVVEAWPYGAARLTDRHRDVIASNEAGAAVWGDINAIIWAFLHCRDVAGWDDVAASIVARLYTDYRLWPDARYRAIIAELMGDAHFREMWQRAATRDTMPPIPITGSLTYTYDGRQYAAMHFPAAVGHPDQFRVALSMPLDASEIAA